MWTAKQSQVTAPPRHAERPRSDTRRPLDGPLLVQRASQRGRCAICQRRYSPGARVTWLPGSGPCHAQCTPASSQDGPIRAALALAARASDAAELRTWLQMCGLVEVPPPWQTGGRA